MEVRIDEEERQESIEAGAKLQQITAACSEQVFDFRERRSSRSAESVQENVDDGDLFDVITYVSNVQADVQTVDGIASLVPNAFVVFGGTGALSATAGTALEGGANGSITNQQHIDFLSKIELLDFHTVALVSSDDSLKAAYAAFARRLREVE
ncbi:phage tail sheath N-terminal beta-sandwich domain-containing protein, partial [Paenibacillus sp. MCAF20]